MLCRSYCKQAVTGDIRLLDGHLLAGNMQLRTIQNHKPRSDNVAVWKTVQWKQGELVDRNAVLGWDFETRLQLARRGFPCWQPQKTPTSQVSSSLSIALKEQKQRPEARQSSGWDVARPHEHLHLAPFMSVGHQQFDQGKRPKAKKKKSSFLFLTTNHGC